MKRILGSKKVVDEIFLIGYNKGMNRQRLELKEVIWVGDSKKRLKEFPEEVQKDIGDDLFTAQAGRLAPSAKPLRGVGSGVFEIRADYMRDTYRAVYAVKIGESIYVLHAFMKKSPRGIKTPQKEIDLIKRRLKMAQEMEIENE